MKGLSDQQKAVLLDQLGLNRGVADAVKILSGAGDEIREYEKALNDAGGMTEEVADKQVESLKGQLDLLQSKFAEVGMIIVEEMTPALESGIQFFDKILDKIIELNSGTDDLITESGKYIKQQSKMDNISKYKSSL